MAPLLSSRLVRHSLRSLCDQSDVGLSKPEASVASGGSHSKPNLAQVFCQLRPFIKLLHVGLLGSPVMSANSSESDHPTSQPVTSMIVMVLRQACPVTSLPKTPARPFGPPWFSDVENQESPRLQGSIGLAKEPAKRGSTIPDVEQVIEAFAQRRDGGARWKFTVEKGCRPEGGFRHALARHCDHVGRNIDSEHSVSSVHKAPSPQTATAAKVDDQPA
jgi:hypothetical protein